MSNSPLFRRAIKGAILSSVLGACSAQAATYYNCANATGCVAVPNINVTSSFDKTKYPVVLAHGLGGFTSVFGLVDYFNGIPQDLTKNGASVYVTKTSSFNDSEVRGEQLLQQVKTIVAITGSPKVNLIGHSQGGIDVRYVAGVAPELVSSVTAVSSPEQGSKVADWVVKTIKEGSAAEGLPEGQFNTASKIVIGLFNFLGSALDVGSGIPFDQIQKQDSWAAANALTTDYAAKFNQKFPAAMPTSYCGYPKDNVVNNVRYYSFSGTQAITTLIDPSDIMLSITGIPFGNDANDGLVSRCSSRLGEVVRDDYKMNHLDSVNQVFGIVSLLDTNPLTVYRNHVNRIKGQEI
jgi:triacylglycerol lipase